MGDSIGNVYADCVDRLLVNIARHFKYLQPGEEPGGAFQWQARKLAELGQVNRENVAIIRRMLEDVPAELAEGLERAIMDALADIEEPLRKAAEDGLIGGGTVQPVVDPRAMQAFQLYQGQSLDGLNLVNSRMLESTAEAYRGMVADITNRLLNARGTINAATGEVLAGVESFNRALELATRRLLDEGLTGFVDGGGRRWKPDTYVAMTMRSTYHNVSRAAFWERNEEYANDLYLVSQHPGARPLCYPWQCKVISRKDEAREEPDGDGNPVHVYAQSETTYGEPAGLFGINCGHHPELFIPGATKVPALMQNEQENAETYALSQKQRKLERDFWKARLDYATAKAQGADETTVKAAQEKLKRADEKLDRFEKETGRRRRREREYGPQAGNPPKPQTSAEKALTDGSGSGTINTKLDIAGRVANPMDEKRYKAMCEGIERQGVKVIQAKGDDLRYLESVGAEATYGNGYIMHRGEIPSSSGMFEETTHMTQARIYGETASSDPIELAAREVAAQHKLLDNGKAYGFSEEDFADIRANFEKWSEEFKN